MKKNKKDNDESSYDLGEKEKKLQATGEMREIVAKGLSPLIEKISQEQNVEDDFVVQHMIGALLYASLGAGKGAGRLSETVEFWEKIIKDMEAQL